MPQHFEEIAVSSANTRVKIAPERGGLVTSFSIDGNDVFYFDRETFKDATKNVRGGIPVLFPNAGPLGANALFNLPQHGFARTMPWGVIEKNWNSLTLQLVSNDQTKQSYPFDFELKLKVEVAENRLIHTMTIKNTGDKPLPTAYGIHPYFEIPQEHKQKLITNVRGFHPGDIDWTGEFDKTFANPGLIKIGMPDKDIIIECDPDTFKFVKIWHQAGQDFICIEPWTRNDFALNDPIQTLWLLPGESKFFSVSISGIKKEPPSKE